MYKKFFGLAIAIVPFLGASALAATVKSDLSWDPSLHQAQSCTEVQNVVQEYVDNAWKSGRFGPVATDGIMVNTPATKAAIEGVGGMGGGGGDAFSATNVQKDGIDEPDIIKTNGKIIYYIDQQKQTLHVVDTDSQKEVKTIKLASNTRDYQLMYYANRLVVIGNSNPAVYSATKLFGNNQQVAVMIYDTTDAKNPTLLQSYGYDGYVQDMRIVDGKLVLVASNYFSRGPIYAAVNDMLYNKTRSSLSSKDFSVKLEDVLPRWYTLGYKSIPKANGGTRVVSTKTSVQVDCKNFLYKKSIPQVSKYPYYMGNGESLTSIISLSLTDAKPTPTIKTIIGNSTQIHVSAKSVYLTSSTYMPSLFMCPRMRGLVCPISNSEGSYTTVYKFALQGLDYGYAAVVPGSTYSQYSMDENKKGVFRIVTSQDANNLHSTSVFTIGADGSTLGKLEAIAPNENFYGVRFIGDALYLVTYKRIDPLFVIDLSDASSPSIIGKITMPGYSSYLHPYGDQEGGVQYLLGLGYDTKMNPAGWEEQGGVKLDLYKIQLGQKSKTGAIAVSQAWSKIYGEAGSQTEALNNPRAFVFNSQTKELVLPLVTANSIKTQNCNVVYDENGVELSRQCYPNSSQSKTTFAGLKVWNVGTDALTEKYSFDYKSSIVNPYTDPGMTNTGSIIDPRWFSGLQPRVGYNTNGYYLITSAFAHLISKDGQQDALITFATSTGSNNIATPLK